MNIDMIYFVALLAIAGMLIIGLAGIYWYTGTDEFKSKTKEEKERFWFG